MSPSLKLRSEEDIYKRESKSGFRETTPQTHHIGIVMRPCEPCALFAVAERSADSAHFIRSHRLTIAASPKDEPGALLLQYYSTTLADDSRIIYGFFREGPDIHDVHALGDEMRFHRFFKRKTCMVSRECNACGIRHCIHGSESGYRRKRDPAFPKL